MIKDASPWLLTAEQAERVEAGHRELMRLQASESEPIKLALQPGATKNVNGVQYKLNENHRWAREGKEAGAYRSKGGFQDSLFDTVKKSDQQGQSLLFEQPTDNCHNFTNKKNKTVQSWCTSI